MKKLLVILLLNLYILSFAITQPIRLCAEWEPTLGTLIRWPLGIPMSLVEELAEDDKLFILVSDADIIDDVHYILSINSINTDNCEFIVAETNSHWTRDWGPHNIFDGDDNWTIIDPLFDGYPWVDGDRDYDEDDVVNPILAEYFQTSSYQMPAYFTGGNIISDGQGNAFSTIQMYDENSNLYTELEFNDIIAEYTGIGNYHFLPNIEEYGIQHIDCGAKLLDEETVLIKKLPAWHPEYYRMESVAEYFAFITNCFGRPYKIHRVYCDSYSGNDCAAYTNSYILNKKVLIPLFGLDSDLEALNKYQQLMPGYQIIGFEYDNWYYYDALHCRTREIMDRDMLYISHRPLDSEQPANTVITTQLFMKAYSNTDIHNAQLSWRYSGNQTWQSINLEYMNENNYQAEFPFFEIGSEIEYYISANDETEREAFSPITAPAAYHSFTITSNSSIDSNNFEQESNLLIYPNPINFSKNAQIKLDLPRLVENATIEIYNLKGQKVVTLSQEEGLNKQQIIWNGIDKQNNVVSSGIYFVHLKNDNKILQRGKMIIIK